MHPNSSKVARVFFPVQIPRIIFLVGLVHLSTSVLHAFASFNDHVISVSIVTISTVFIKGEKLNNNLAILKKKIAHLIPHIM